MGYHLKRDAVTGHLLRSFDGHLVNECDACHECNGAQPACSMVAAGNDGDCANVTGDHDFDHFDTLAGADEDCWWVWIDADGAFAGEQALAIIYCRDTKTFGARIDFVDAVYGVASGGVSCEGEYVDVTEYITCTDGILTTGEAGFELPGQVGTTCEGFTATVTLG